MTDWAFLIPEVPSDWALLPLNGNKQPIDPVTGDLLNDWSQSDGFDIETLSKANGFVKAVGLKLGPDSGGVLQLDLDGPPAKAKFQSVYGREISDLPSTISVTSQRPDRMSAFFLVDLDWWPHLPGRKSWKSEDGETCLELRWAGHQAAIAGAHPLTDGYRWLKGNAPGEIEMAKAPDWLLEPLVRSEETYEPVEVSTADAQRAEAMLKFIDPQQRTSYDDWLEVGMALYHTDEGLLSAWVEWSKSMPNFDEEECLHKWPTFKGYTGKPITIRTLHHWAKQGGYKEPKGEATGDLEGMGWTALLETILDCIRCRKPDREMKARAEIKTRFRVTDDQLNTALFKRHGEGKVAAVKQTHDSVSLAAVEALNYQMDGWIQKGDVGLLYGAFGTGKTTLALWKAIHLAKGQNILDRNTPCTPRKSLFIATDSGLGPLKKSLEDLGIDPDTDPMFIPGHPDQMIYIWGYDPKQGHAAWICDIAGVIHLEQFIEAKNIGYVPIDSAKSVSSAAGWSYTSNESVKALLKHLREAVAMPTGAFIEFLSHDGTEKGSHSGAKAWAEDPSMVTSLLLQKDEQTGHESVVCQFKKDRAAVVDPRRKLTFSLEDCQLVVAPEVEVVSTCEDAIVEVLWTAHQNQVIWVKGKELKAEVFERFRKTAKTVENTLPRIKGKRIVSPHRGCWKLSPSEIQRLEATRSPFKCPSSTGGVNKKNQLYQGIRQPPDPVFGSGVRGNCKPPSSPTGEWPGGSQSPVTATDSAITPPLAGGHPTQNASDLPDWAQPDDGQPVYTSEPL